MSFSQKVFFVKPRIAVFFYSLNACKLKIRCENVVVLANLIALKREKYLIK